MAVDPLLFAESGAANLTKRQIEVLQKMRDDDEELVYEKGYGYIDLDPVGRRTVFALLRYAAIRLEDSEVGGVERYTINETGRDILRRRGL